MNDKDFEQLLESVNQAEEIIRKLEERIDEGDSDETRMHHYYIPLMGSHISQPVISLMTRYGELTLPDSKQYYSKINTADDGEVNEI